MEKMTYVNAIDNALMVVTDKATREKLEALKASLVKKASNKKMTANQENNEILKTVILEKLAETNVPMTCTELINSDERLDLSIPKISALMRQLVESKQVVKTIDKKKSLFSLPQ